MQEERIANLNLFAKMTKASGSGLTLLELLFAVSILAVAISGLLLLFVNCIVLNNNSRNFILAYNGIEAKMEEMKNVGYNGLYVTCPTPRPSGTFCSGDSFDLVGFTAGNAKGAIEISNQATSLKRIKIDACFMSRNRLIGNDINNCTSSPVELVTLIAND